MTEHLDGSGDRFQYIGGKWKIGQHDDPLLDEWTDEGVAWESSPMTKIYFEQEDNGLVAQIQPWDGTVPADEADAVEAFERQAGQPVRWLPARRNYD